MKVKRAILRRIYISYFFFALFAVLIFLRIIHIQTVKGGELRKQALNLTTKFETIHAERGNVYSEDGKLLATSLPSFEIRMDMKADGLTKEVFDAGIDSLSFQLGKMFPSRNAGSWKTKLQTAFNKKSRYVLIQNKVSYPQLLEMQTWPIFKRGQFKGGFIAKGSNRRKNPYGLLAHRTIGYVRDNSKSVGLESYFDEYVAGVDGKQLMQRISGKTYIPINDKEEIEARHGMDLNTTLDVQIQDIATSALASGIKEHQAHHGSVVVMEVKTGKIKAIANLVRKSDNSVWEDYNYAVGEGTEPGSTFKLASALVLLEDGYVRAEDSVNLHGGIYRFYDRDMRDAHTHGKNKVSFSEAFHMSSNVGISKLLDKSYRSKPKKFISHLEDLGLTSKTGITIKGESEPYVLRPGTNEWSGVSLPWLSIGYGIQLTPLQILQFYNAVANDGRMMRPYLVNSVSEFGKEVKEFEPEVMNKSIASEKTIKTLQSLLKGVFEEGTAKALRSSSLALAGKTGTAQISDATRGYVKRHQASFVGYFPADEPKYSVVVVVNKPSAGSYYGSSVAGPIFKEIAEKVYAGRMEQSSDLLIDSLVAHKNLSLGLAYSEELEVLFDFFDLEHSAAETDLWAKPQVQGEQWVLEPHDIESGKMPGLVGLGLRDALYILENMGLKVQTQGRGKIYKQSIPKGQAIRKGQSVQINLKP